MRHVHSPAGAGDEQRFGRSRSDLAAQSRCRGREALGEVGVDRVRDRRRQGDLTVLAALAVDPQHTDVPRGRATVVGQVGSDEFLSPDAGADQDLDHCPVAGAVAAMLCQQVGGQQQRRGKPRTTTAWSPTACPLPG